MKKITFFLSMFLCFMLGAVTAHAQIWVDGDGSAALGTESSGQYTYHSGEFTAPTNPSKLRLVFLATNTNRLDDGYIYADNSNSHGRHPFVNFAEFYLYDAAGNRVTLTASNFSSNATEPTEGSFASLCDDETHGTGSNWFWHSMWTTTPNCDHYLEIAVPDGIDLSTFSYGYVSCNDMDIPTKVMLIAGNDNLAAHDELNTIEKVLESKSGEGVFGGVYLSREGNAFRVLAPTKTAFEKGNTDLSELRNIYENWSDVIPSGLAFCTEGRLIDATNPTRKVFVRSEVVKFTPVTPRVRLTVTQTNTGGPYGQINGHVYFCLSELKVYIDGKALDLSAANLTGKGACV